MTCRPVSRAAGFYFRIKGHPVRVMVVQVTARGPDCGETQRVPRESLSPVACHLTASHSPEQMREEVHHVMEESDELAPETGVDLVAVFAPVRAVAF